MGIMDWYEKRKSENEQAQQISDVARAQAQEEAQVILDERQAAKDRDIYEQAKSKELRKLTTTRGERFIEGAKKVGEKLQSVSNTLDQQRMRSEGQVSQLGRDIGSTFSQAQSLGGLTQQSSIVAPKRKGVSDLINMDNMNTKMGNKIFGNTFTQGKYVSEGTGQGFMNMMSRTNKGLNVENIGRFSQDNPYSKQKTSRRLDKESIGMYFK